MLSLLLSISLLSGAIVTTYFIYTKNRANKALRARQKSKKDYFMLGNLFWKIFSTSGHAIILLQNNKIVDINHAACKLFGAHPNDVIGKTPFDLSPEYQPDGTLSVTKGKNFLKNIMAEGTVGFEWWHKKVNGELFLAKISASSFESDGKHYDAVTLIDITVSTQEQQELQDYRLKLEQLLEEKTEKLAKANQELLAQNEELDAFNEEYYSANEELNATNEKLEQTNSLLQNEITEHEKTQAEREIYRKQLESLLEQKTEYLEQLKERFTEVYTNTSDAFTFLDVIYDDPVTLKVFDMNPVAQKLFSVSKEQIKKGLAASDFIPKADYEAFMKDTLPRLLAGNNVTIKKEANLTSVYWQSTITPIKDKNGKVIRIVVFSKDITAEYEREKISTILNAAIDSWPFEFWARDINGVQILQNKVSRERSGNLIGKRIDDIEMPEDTRKQSEQLIKRVLSGENISIETEIMDSGQKRYIIYKLNPIVTSTGIGGYTAIAIDITERKMAEILLKESEERFRSTAQLSKNLVYDFDLKANIINWDGAVEEVTGYTFDEYKNVSFDQWVEMIHPDDKEWVVALFHESLSQLKPFQAEYRYKNKDNQYRWIEEDTHIIVAPDNTPVKLLGVLKDITQRKKSEEKIRKSEEKYRLLAENIDDVIWKMDIKTSRYTYFSPSIIKLTGYSVEEALELTPEQILMPDSLNDLLIALPEWINHFNNGDPASQNKTFEYQIKHKKGFPVWVEINAKLVKDSFGAATEIIATSRSIEERKASELLLNESEKKLRTIFDTTKDSIILLNENMEIFDINRSAIEHSEYTREEMIGKNFLDFLIKKAPTSNVQHYLSIMDAKVIKNLEVDAITKSGRTVPAEISMTPTQIKGQNMLLLMIRDISERKELEKKLLHSVINTEEQERIHFSQELHDGLGPILSAAKMYAEWLAEPGAGVDPSFIITDLKKLLEESTRTVKDISFKLSPHILQNYGIVEAIKAYAEKATKTAKTQLVIDADNNIGRLDEIIETIVYRVITECINNALKYAQAAHIIVALTITDNMLNIHISDDGVGFDISTISQKHKGMGLLNIQSRLKSINGNFYLKSTTNKGTEISINVPLQDG